ncbi:hypothetical protein F4810DRAFT_344137 [Camillea tinctor]|nr:hypothetical protein F4810DRAFT_344137 [Camillea tinctor]
MHHFRKRSLVNILSRKTSDKTAEETTFSKQAFTAYRTNLSRFDVIEEDEEKGPLGLTTIWEPSDCETVADIIFIHGLGGGSRKTWSKTSSPLSFWPKQWLPEDVDFRGVRIHTFGYNADWGERRQSILNIHDFAQTLLGELKNNPSIRRSGTQLILVGHSMGGCVAKKTYILARQDVSCKEIASRIFSIFFLGTPHRGSDLATILQNILQVTWGTKPFVSDLLPNSVTLSEINDSFRHYAGDLHLWSFYETVPMNAKILNKLVVEKHSATLGYSNEEISAMDADHRHVCKFDNKLDPNYRKLRNALCTAIDIIRSRTPQDTPREALARAEGVLGLSDVAFEDDLVPLQEIRQPGSCSWFTEKPHFDAWRHADAASPAILWLTGHPAAGKSVLCSHIIDHLTSQNLPCSYFFFKHKKSGRSTLVDFFRGIAYQMACQDKTVLQRILQFDNEGDMWDRNDEKSIWRKLFLQGLFKLDTISNHIWIIDGFDECSNFSNWFKLFPHLPDRLRIFITSRSLEEIERGITSLGPRVRKYSLAISDTVDDIRSYIMSKLEELSLGDNDNICERILTKSQGSFLWVRLVLEEFENAFTDKDIENILNEVPDDLHNLYLRMLESIENNERRTKIAKSILTWVTLARRPLTVDELCCAVKLDIQETPHNMEKTIITVCGQLVVIDQANRVHMIHETAREFLLSDKLQSSLAVKRGDHHGHLALICCKYLSGGVLKTRQGFKPTRTSKPFSIPDPALVNYASRFFSEHLRLSNPSIDELSQEFIRFLKSSVLYWVEKISQDGDLSPIAGTGVNMARYLCQRAKNIPSIDENMRIMDAWATDLVRVGAKFRSKLLACPSSIHYLIPPFCPSESIISKTFNIPTRSLMVKGSIDKLWDDCLVRIDFPKGYTTALTHGESYFAIGLSSGQISVYDANFVRHILRFQHPGRVNILAFDGNEEHLASGGQKHISIWHLKSGTSIYTCSLESPLLALHFINTESLAHLDKYNNLFIHNTKTCTATIIPWDSAASLPEMPPSKAALSSDLGIFAVGYRGHPILMFDLETAAYLGQCVSTKSNGIDAMTFNPNPSLSALVVSNVDGELLMFDPRTTDLKFQKSNVYAHTLACSPDGARLVTGSSQGLIEVYEFGGYDGDSLTLIYRLDESDEGIRSIAFNFDGLRIIDCRGSQACIWEPAVLTQQDIEIGSYSDVRSQPAIAPKTFGFLDSHLDAEIMTLTCHSDGMHVLCGKSNGNVAVYSTHDGQQQEVLYSHSRSVSVIAVALVEEHGLTITADEAGRILIAKISPSWSQAEVIVDRRFDGVILGILVSANNDRVLFVGKEIDELWALPSGDILKAQPSEQRGLRTVINQPGVPDVFISFTISTARLFRWEDFGEIPKAQWFQIQRPNHNAMSDPYFHAAYYGDTAIIEAIKFTVDGGGTQLYSWNPSSFQGAYDTLPKTTDFDILTPRIRSVISVVGSTLIFLDIDLWICSIDVNSFHNAPYAKRHFFIPSEWHNVNGEIVCAFTSRNDFVFVNKNGIVVIGHGLEFSETITPSLQKIWEVQAGGSMHRRASSGVIKSISAAGNTRGNPPLSHS